mmetsp:Transcript_49184/g.73119  ORF Transcript_49184/g.73119 Transcript_49184/m.73119 type:complete len:261 (-) Transcript_49184:318-1100(-)|eukprot:CAMPEP_0195521428 /NCGR_PEP_ID=MMETSP0794_2-20130614/18641_1 /TAXON_ID=515487 /ORGANISM="Stephanopyxis turris, Strain CCMP 815" /LENGTH=260 /DNA_ID=CAMNT_0040650979 /DNA_START=276 /DNA_END=1061 /DNA_ORIENTATION=+
MIPSPFFNACQGISSPENIFLKEPLLQITEQTERRQGGRTSERYINSEECTEKVVELELAKTSFMVVSSPLYSSYLPPLHSQKKTKQGKPITPSIQKYVFHIVLPTDTLQGICLSYKIHATKLRQMNNFSGSGLLLAPPKLIIPIDESVQDKIKVQNHDSPEYKIYSVLAEFPKLLRRSDAIYYLESSGWDIHCAIDNALRDNIHDDNLEKYGILRHHGNMSKAAEKWVQSLARREGYQYKSFEMLEFEMRPYMNSSVKS